MKRALAAVALALSLGAPCFAEQLGNGSPECDEWIADTRAEDAGDPDQLAEDLNDLPAAICGALEGN